MNSCLYECSVYHKRLRPKVREFRYRIFMFALDLDELDAITREIPLFSRNRWNCYAFNDRDHLNLGRGTVKENVIVYAETAGAVFPDGGRLVLVTLPRVLGYIFNPVSFYFCYDSAGSAWSVNRNWNSPVNRYHSLGVRLAQVPGGKKKEAKP